MPYRRPHTLKSTLQRLLWLCVWAGLLLAWFAAPAAAATYTVTTQSPVPITQADPSAVSNTIPSVGYDKDGIPGVDDIFVGTDKVYKVMAGTSQIWLG